MAVVELKAWSTELAAAATPGAVGPAVDVKGLVAGRVYEVRCDFDVVIDFGSAKLSRLSPRAHSTKDGAVPLVFRAGNSLQVAAFTSNVTVVSFYPVHSL